MAAFHPARRMLAPTLAALALVGMGMTLAAPAHADTIGTVLSLNGYHQMVGDLAGSGGTGYLYISEGSGHGIAVVTPSGALATTLDASDVVEGITLSNGYIFAADASANAVQVIDPLTNTQVATWPLPAGDTPHSVVGVWNTLWVSYTDGSTAPDGAIGEFPIPANTTNSSIGSSTFVPDAVPGTYSWTSAPDLASDGGSGTLAASDEGSSPETVAVYNAPNTPATTVLAPTALPISDGAGAAVFGGGGQVAFIGSTPDEAYVYNLDDPSLPNTFPVTGSPNSVAASGANDGSVAVGTAQDAYLYGQGGSLYNVLPVPGLVPQGLAWGSTGVIGANGLEYALYAVTDNGGSYALDTFDAPETTTTTVTLTGASTAVGGGTVSLSGQLSYASGVGVPDAAVTIRRHNPDGSTSTLAGAQTNSTGGFTISNIPPAAGAYMYSAAYAGVQNWDGSLIEQSTGSASVTVALNTAALTVASSTVLPLKAYMVTGKLTYGSGTPAVGTQVSVKVKSPSGAMSTVTTRTSDASGDFSFSQPGQSAVGKYTYTATVAATPDVAAASGTGTVTVAKAAAPLAISTAHTEMPYESTFTVTAHLGATHSNRKVSIYAELYPSRTQTLIASGTVNSSGNLTVTDKNATRNVIFSATFTGDAQYNSGSTRVVVDIAARVSMKNTGSYTTTAHDNVTFHTYRHTAKLGVSVTVAPSKPGETVDLVIQQLVNGQWVNDKAYTETLNSASSLSGYLSLPSTTGGYYRIRAVFVPSSKDVTNVGYNSGWYNFNVVS